MRISVVTVARNVAATIADTLASVRAQDWPDYEHIVVDGASTDDTIGVVAAAAHPKLRWISEPDRGLYDAMNKGLRMATGEIVGFLNANDFFVRPDALRIVAEAFARSDADCVAGQTVIVDHKDITRVRRLYRSEGFRPWMLRFGHMPPHPSFYARKSALDRVGGFDPDYMVSGDFDLMVKLLLLSKATFVGLPETLTAFRVGGVSTKDIPAKMTINREVTRSLANRGVGSNRLMLWARYPFKALQLVGRPRDYPDHLPAMGLLKPAGSLSRGTRPLPPGAARTRQPKPLA